MSQLSPVTFHGDTIFCLTYENQPYTPMKPIVENMGISWQGQQAKLTTNVERWGIKMILIPTASGQQDMLCMPVRKLPAYLSSINPKKVRPELRAKIELYQNESDDALWNYWVNGRAERPIHDTSCPSRRSDPERKALTAIINTWVGMAPIHYASARAQVNAHFGVASVDSLTIGQVKDAIRWVQGKIDALPASPAPAKALPRTPADERPFLDFVDEVRKTHAQVQELQKRLLSRGYKLALALCHDIQDRARMSSKDSTCSLDRLLLDYMTHGIEEALVYPSDTLPDYRNPGFALLDIVRQLNAR